MAVLWPFCGRFRSWRTPWALAFHSPVIILSPKPSPESPCDVPVPAGPSQTTGLVRPISTASSCGPRRNSPRGPSHRSSSFPTAGPTLPSPPPGQVCGRRPEVIQLPAPSATARAGLACPFPGSSPASYVCVFCVFFLGSCSGSQWFSSGAEGRSLREEISFRFRDPLQDLFANPRTALNHPCRKLPDGGGGAKRMVR